MKNLKLSIIIPAYNEADFIGSSLTTLHKYLKKQGWEETTELIIVNADSTDKTREIVQDKRGLFKNFKLITPGSKVGKGRDTSAGFAEAEGQFQVFMDADFATPIKHLEPLLEKLEAGGGVVYGVRSLSSMHDTFSRKLTSMLSNLYIRALILPGVRDSQCGFKGFSKKAAKEIFLRRTIDGWGFDAELLKIAMIQKIPIKSIPIPDWSDPKGDQGLVGENQLKAKIKTLWEILKIRVNAWKGSYK